ncbi:mucin-5AC-like [Octopus sinensis]|uniref:Mucin-5AC-like n=1 Tax=Octopus sinensis TaxID=2607531 RepID=A0A7E6FLC1_9MOLL|nr:mucin-5AC-like [Octopus sinensis]
MFNSVSSDSLSSEFKCAEIEFTLHLLDVDEIKYQPSFLVVVIKGQISTPQRVVTEDTEVKDSVTVPTQTLTESQTGGRALDVPTGVTISDIDSSTTETVESDSVTGTERNLPKASFTNTKVVEYTAPTTSTSNTNSSMDTSTDTNNNNKSNSNVTSNSRDNSLALSSVTSTILDINDSTKESVFTAIDVDVTTTTTTASTTTTATTTTTAAVTTTIASNGEIVVSTRLPNSELVQRPTDFSVTRIQTALPTPPIGIEPNKDQFMCYHGNCTDYQCHKAVKIYSMFHKVPCVGRKCQIEILQREDSFFIKFQCLNNSKECPCLSKVPNLQKMCCKTSLCNNHTLMCRASSSSSSATFVWKYPNLIRSLLLLFSFYQQH